MATVLFENREVCAILFTFLEHRHDHNAKFKIIQAMEKSGHTWNTGHMNLKQKSWVSMNQKWMKNELLWMSICNLVDFFNQEANLMNFLEFEQNVYISYTTMDSKTS